MPVSLQAGARPPYVVFETRALENRNETLARGHLVNRDVDFVIVRQPGAKDTFEQEALIWLPTLDKDPNWAPEWVAAVRAKYDQWKAGHEPTEDGLHVSQWPAISKAQASMLIGVNIRTVEDLATANEASLGRIGIAARELQNKAKEFLKVANDTGKAAEELSALRARAQGQDEVIARQTDELKRLAALVEGLTVRISGQSVEKALAAAPAAEPNFM